MSVLSVFMRMFCSASEYVAKVPVTSAESGRAKERMAKEAGAWRRLKSRLNFTTPTLKSYNHTLTVNDVTGGDGGIQVPAEIRPM